MRIIGRIEPFANGKFGAGYNAEPDSSVYVGSESIGHERQFDNRKEAEDWLKSESDRLKADLWMEGD